MKNTAIHEQTIGHSEAIRRLRSLLCLALLSAIPFTAGVSQSPIAPNGGLPGPGRTSQGFAALPENANPHPDGVRILRDSMQQQDDQKKQAAANALRQKEIADDTAKLLQLANDLKAEMDKTGKDTLNMNVVRKAEQIEKLAHQVRDKMRASLGS